MFRSQPSMRCYRHAGCSWLLSKHASVSEDNMIRWLLAGTRPEVDTKDKHFRLRAAFSKP
eukprot:6446376-Alexandrium_andersonii.AAC.1